MLVLPIVYEPPAEDYDYGYGYAHESEEEEEEGYGHSEEEEEDEGDSYSHYKGQRRKDTVGVNRKGGFWKGRSKVNTSSYLDMLYRRLVIARSFHTHLNFSIIAKKMEIECIIYSMGFKVAALHIYRS